MRNLVVLLAPLVLFGPSVATAQADNRVTILYDAFGSVATMTKDWGFSALIEIGGKRFLFDTGNNAEVFARNARACRDRPHGSRFVVMSHRHLDHTAGLDHLVSVNPGVTIYAPKESFGVFGSSLPSSFYRRDEDLPTHLRYYDGAPPDTMTFGSAWPEADFEYIDESMEVAPGIHVLSLVSDTPGTKELRELSLAIETREGLVVVVGCSHPGVERIVKAATAIDERVHLVVGGFHMPTAPDAEIQRVADVLKSTLHVQHLAPGHCTGEPAQHGFRRLWGKNYIYAGVGSVINLGLRETEKG